MRGERAIPRPAAVYGGAGLIPFAAGALAVWLAPAGWDARALDATLAYGTAILSFLGAVHWGLALAGAGTNGDSRAACTWPRLGWAITPALLGWLALLLVPLLGAAVLIAGFAAAASVDLRAVRAGLMPAWYGALRKLLSVGAIVCLAVASAPALPG